MPLDSGFEFWGVTLKPSKVAKCTVEDALLHITSICLDSTVTNAKERSVVTVSHNDREFCIASLREGVTEQVTLDLCFKEGEQFKFRVSGSTSVHLVGYLQPLSDGGESDSDASDKDFEACESDSEDESLDGTEAPDLISTEKLKSGNVQTKKRFRESNMSCPVQNKNNCNESDDELLSSQERRDEENESDDSSSDEDASPAPVAVTQLPAKKKAKKTMATNSSTPNSTQNSTKNASVPSASVKVNKAEDFSKLQGGLLFKDIEVGHGKVAKRGNKLGVFYTGRLHKGKIFDSNAKSSKPFNFKLGSGDVIKAWDFGLLGMKVGGKRLLVCPPKMAYGKAGAGSEIPPNSTLVFEVELARIK